MHNVRTCSAVFSVLPHSQSGERARPICVWTNEMPNTSPQANSSCWSRDNSNKLGYLSRAGMLWNGMKWKMEWKANFGIEYKIAKVWNGMEDFINGMERIFHTCSF